MPNRGRTNGRILPQQPAKKGDGDSLVEAEDVFVHFLPRRCFPFLPVAVQIDYVDSAKDAQQLAAHHAEGDVVEKAVVGDKADNAATCPLDLPLGIAEEFYVVVVQPGFSLPQPLAAGDDVSRTSLVAADEFRDPFAPVRGEAGEGGIAEENQWELRIADCGLRIGRRICESIAKCDLNLSAPSKIKAGLRQPEEDVELCGQARGGNDLDTLQAWQQVPHHVLVPVFAPRDGLADDIKGFEEKCSGPGGGVENRRLCEAAGEVEFLLQLAMDIASDKPYELWRSVEDAPSFAMETPMFVEEVFVEVGQVALARGKSS
jgi:hypothetical protein